MMDFGDLPPGEIIRRREKSNDAMREREREEWAAWYQERCDHDYWSKGQCCAGCDFWASDKGCIGQCLASPIMPGREALLTLGITFCSYNPAPQHPWTQSDHWCGMFKDDFDWTTLDREYLRRIGALKKVERGQKPQPPA